MNTYQWVYVRICGNIKRILVYLEFKAFNKFVTNLGTIINHLSFGKETEAILCKQLATKRTNKRSGIFALIQLYGLK